MQVVVLSSAKDDLRDGYFFYERQGGAYLGNYFLASLAATTSDVVSFVCSLLVILGVGSMAAQLGNEELMERCSRIFKIILAIGVMSLLARFFMLFWGSVFAQALVFSLAVLSIFLGFFQYFLYISMLAKAKKMLNE